MDEAKKKLKQNKRYLAYFLIIIAILAVIIFRTNINPFAIKEPEDLSDYTELNFPCSDDIKAFDEQQNQYDVKCKESLTLIKIPQQNNKVYFIYYDKYRKEGVTKIKKKENNITFIIQNENLMKYK